MSVPVGMRSESKREVFELATELECHTLRITSNQNVFRPEYKALTDKIVDAALEIGLSIWTANDIRVTNAMTLEDRQYLQNKAVVQCDRLLYLITVAARANHLRAKKVAHWSEMTRRVKTLIRKWKDSDAKRLSRGVKS